MDGLDNDLIVEELDDDTPLEVSEDDIEEDLSDKLASLGRTSTQEEIIQLPTIDRFLMFDRTIYEI